MKIKKLKIIYQIIDWGKVSPAIIVRKLIEHLAYIQLFQVAGSRSLMLSDIRIYHK